MWLLKKWSALIAIVCFHFYLHSISNPAWQPARLIKSTKQWVWYIFLILLGIFLIWYHITDSSARWLWVGCGGQMRNHTAIVFPHTGWKVYLHPESYSISNWREIKSGFRTNEPRLDLFFSVIFIMQYFIPTKDDIWYMCKLQWIIIKPNIWIPITQFKK